MEGIIDKENERVRRFFALLDNMEKKVERLARDNRPPFNGERFLTDRELSGTLKISRRSTPRSPTGRYPRTWTG